MEQCQKNGFSVAPFHLCNSLEQATAATEEFGFPVIVKVSHSVGGIGVTRINSSEELAIHVATLHENFAVQKYVTGTEITIEMLFDKGRPRCYVTSEVLNRWPRRLGPSTARKIIDLPDTLQMLEKIGKLTNFHGFAGIDAIMPSDGGPPMLCEMNPRQTTGYHFDPKVRREFAQALSEMLENKSFGDYTPLPATGNREALFPEAIYYLTSNLRESSRWVCAMNSLKRVPLDDPKYLFQILNDFRHFVKGEIKKRLLTKK